MLSQLAGVGCDLDGRSLALLVVLPDLAHVGQELGRRAVDVVEQLVVDQVEVHQVMSAL